MSSLRRVIESGPYRHSRATTCSRVGSPSAANTGADSRRRTATVLRAFDIPRDVLQLLGPPAVVAAKRFVAAARRDAVESRLDDGQAGPVWRVGQRELDQRGR